MSKPSIRPLRLLGAMVMLAPLAAAGAPTGSQPKHGIAKLPHSTAAQYRTPAHRREPDTGTQTWLMVPLGLAAAGFAIRRQQRTLDSLQPLVN